MARAGPSVTPSVRAAIPACSSPVVANSVPIRPKSPHFLRNHLWLPLAAGVSALVLLALFDLDRVIALNLFYDPTAGGWIGRDSLWMNEVLHTSGRNLMRLIGVLAIVGWAASFRLPSLQPHRRTLGYFALCMALVPLTVGGLKAVTNVDCPWDIAGFGGTRPYLEWFVPRPDSLPHAACFPGAHSSSAFALFALYFLALATGHDRRRLALLAVLVLGALFSLAQQSRGAHFLSHDLASALIAWFMCLGLHLQVFKDLYERSDAESERSSSAAST